MAPHLTHFDLKYAATPFCRDCVESVVAAFDLYEVQYGEPRDGSSPYLHVRWFTSPDPDVKGALVALSAIVNGRDGQCDHRHLEAHRAEMRRCAAMTDYSAALHRLLAAGDEAQEHRDRIALGPWPDHLTRSNSIDPNRAGGVNPWT